MFYSPIDGQGPTFTITDTKIYVPVVTLSTKLIFRFLIDPSFQGVNRLSVLSFENTDGRTSYTRYCD